MAFLSSAMKQELVANGTPFYILGVDTARKGKFGPQMKLEVMFDRNCQPSFFKGNSHMTLTLPYNKYREAEARSFIHDLTLQNRLGPIYLDMKITESGYRCYTLVDENAEKANHDIEKDGLE